LAAPAHIVVLRFSAMGDVALLAPVLKTAAEENPGTKITLVTRPKFSGLFKSIRSVHVFPADVDSEFKGISGLLRLAAEIRALNPDVVIDVHDHLRTRILRFLLQLHNIRIVVFNKGRKEKKLFIRLKDKSSLKPLPHTCERYRLALTEAGLKISDTFSPPLVQELTGRSLPAFLQTATDKRLVGIAPFAAHFTKIWPLERFAEVIRSFSGEKNIAFLLFGGGKTEVEKLEKLTAGFENCINIAGKLSLEDELALMRHLEVMVCVDSSNMHLASLWGTPVLSIWGGTHTGTGFGPLPNSRNRIIEIPAETLTCRPCSVYGLVKCPRKDHACMQQISSGTVVSALREMLQQNS
jgi:ADP-heptose:LPS heptosyltransferase